MDSLGERGDEHLDTIVSYLSEEWKAATGKGTIWNSYDMITIIPQQMNARDCGIYICMYAKHLMESCMAGRKEEAYSECFKQLPASISSTEVRSQLRKELSVFLSLHGKPYSRKKVKREEDEDDCILI
jgi:Ulp1 family protease